MKNVLILHQLVVIVIVVLPPNHLGPKCQALIMKFFYFRFGYGGGEVRNKPENKPPLQQAEKWKIWYHVPGERCFAPVSVWICVTSSSLFSTYAHVKYWHVNVCLQILSRGQLVKYHRFEINRQTLISLIVPITKEMLPSFRIIAYYHTAENEVVSDSVWVDVKDTCMGSVRHTTQTKQITVHSCTNSSSSRHRYKSG